MATYNAPFRDKNSERYMYAGRIERMIETVEQKLVLRSLVLDDYYLGKIISDKMITLDELAENIKNVTKEDVMEVAEKIQLDTVYFLKGCEN